MTPPEYIQTYTRRAVRLVDPNPDSIAIEDIAHALARTCRFGGHSRTFYSVAEHSIHVMRFVRSVHKLGTGAQKAALLHDAAEAYLGDVVKPLKVVLGDAYRELERGFERAIGERFGVDFESHRASTRDGDLRCLMSEAEQLLPGGPHKADGGHWPNLPGWSGCLTASWDPAIAEARFLAAADALGVG